MSTFLHVMFWNHVSIYSTYCNTFWPGSVACIWRIVSELILLQCQQAQPIPIDNHSVLWQVPIFHMVFRVKNFPKKFAVCVFGKDRIIHGNGPCGACLSTLESVCLYTLLDCRSFPPSLDRAVHFILQGTCNGPSF